MGVAWKKEQAAATDHDKLEHSSLSSECDVLHVKDCGKIAFQVLSVSQLIATPQGFFLCPSAKKKAIPSKHFSSVQNNSRFCRWFFQYLNVRYRRTARARQVNKSGNTANGPRPNS